MNIDDAAWTLVHIVMAMISTYLLLDWCVDHAARNLTRKHLMCFPDACPICMYYRFRYRREAPPHKHCREGRWPGEERR
jgi:hypothetical protein